MASKTGITLKLTNEDGNAFFILYKAKERLDVCGMGHLWANFKKEATDGDYDHLLSVCMKWFEVE